MSNETQYMFMMRMNFIMHSTNSHWYGIYSVSLLIKRKYGIYAYFIAHLCLTYANIIVLCFASSVCLHFGIKNENGAKMSRKNDPNKRIRKDQNRWRPIKVIAAARVYMSNVQSPLIFQMPKIFDKQRAHHSQVCVRPYVRIVHVLKFLNGFGFRFPQSIWILNYGQSVRRSLFSLYCASWMCQILFAPLFAFAHSNTPQRQQAISSQSIPRSDHHTAVFDILSTKLTMYDKKLGYVSI